MCCRCNIYVYENGIPKIHHCADTDIMEIGSTRQFNSVQTVLFGILIFAQSSVIAVAQESADPMEVCFRMTDPGARYACYDHEMQRRHAVAAPGPGIAPPAPAGADAPATLPGTPSTTTPVNRPIDDTIGLDGKQLILKRKAEGLQPERVQPIVAAIAALKQRPGHLYYFELDNGQVWESTDSEPELFLGPHETVRIRPGVLGAFFLKTQEGNSIRVHRVR
jgi:hypothetical protein